MKFSVTKEDENKIGVYCIKNIINNEIYIGSTSNSFYNRYHQHIYSFKNGIRHQRLLFNAFQEYGIINFEFTVICICSKNECFRLEQIYLDKGTNYNVSKTAVSLLGIIHPSDSKTRVIKGAKHHCAIPVDKYSLHGKKIKSYGSVIDAIIDIKASRNSLTHIVRCCKGISFKSLGFRWAFKNKPLFKRSMRRTGNCNVIIRKGKIVKKFNSQLLAAKYLQGLGINAYQGTISAAIRKNRKAYGFTITKV